MFCRRIVNKYTADLILLTKFKRIIGMKERSAQNMEAPVSLIYGIFTPNPKELWWFFLYEFLYFTMFFRWIGLSKLFCLIFSWLNLKSECVSTNVFPNVFPWMCFRESVSANVFPICSLRKPKDFHWFKMSCLTCLAFSCVYCFFLKRWNYIEIFVLHE